MTNNKMVLVPHSAFTRLMNENLDKTKEYIGELGQKAETLLENSKLSGDAKSALYNQALGQQLQLRKTELQRVPPPPPPPVSPAPVPRPTPRPRRPPRRATPRPRPPPTSDTDSSGPESTYEKTYMKRVPAAGQIRKKNPPVRWVEK